MLLLLVRHAESENNALLERLRSENVNQNKDAVLNSYDRAKSSDPSLSELGIAQAHRCGDWIQRYLQSMEFLPDSYRIELVSSPMERALRTAEVLAGQLSLQAEIWSDIHETKGCWNGGQTVASPGRGASEILAAVGTAHFCNSVVAPVPDSGWWTDELTGAARDKETPEESCERARCVAARLRVMALSADTPTVKILVTHGNWMSLLVQALISPQGSSLSLPAIKHDNTALTAIVLPGTPNSLCSLVQLNRSEHLDAEPAIRRTRQHTELSGYAAGRRSPTWVPPAGGSAPRGSTVERLKESCTGLAGTESLALLAGAAGIIVMIAGAFAVLATTSRRSRSNLLEHFLKL